MKKFFVVGTILIALIAYGLFEFGNNLSFFKKNSEDKNLASYAKNIVEKCSSASYKQTCYDEEIPKLMDSISMEDAFKVTRIVQDIDKSYAYCHVLGHKLSSLETAKDPSKWKDVINRCPSGTCSNGCIHGAFQERFRSETLDDEQIAAFKPEFMDICEPRSGWNPTGLEQGTCYHALGHLMMYITGADINKSVKLCEEVSIKSDGRDWSPLCFDGSFMQIFQPLDDEDFVLIAGKEIKKDELYPFCSKFTGEKRNSCWSEGWPLFLDEIVQPKGLVKFCSNSLMKTDHDRTSCYNDLFYVLTAQLRFDINRIKDFCKGLPEKVMNQCFADAASRFIETDYRNIPVVIDLCSSLESATSKDVCFQELIKYSTYNFHSGSQEFFQLCNGLPEPWRGNCLSGK